MVDSAHYLCSSLLKVVVKGQLLGPLLVCVCVKYEGGLREFQLTLDLFALSLQPPQITVVMDDSRRLQ
jgi:hypothetical protein